MSAGTRLAAIPLDRDELVVSVDERDRIDVRLWTDTGGIRFPSKHGIAVPRHALPEIIAALELARRRDAA